MAAWNHFATDAAGYLRERILTPRIGLLWLLVFAATAATVAEPRPWAWLAVAAAWFLLVFRLGDDLADLDFDRRYHPQRRLVRSRETSAFRLMLVFLVAGLVVLTAWVAGTVQALGLLLLVAALAGVYRWTQDRPELRPLRIALVLGKYPAWILLLADRPWQGLTLAAALAVFVPPALHELRAVGRAMLVPVAAVAAAVIAVWVLAA
ncbi:hypothetical protein [Thioalkalivibrio paradoxus]|uniref:UbiA prenyltransferase n=1 Tax=Thioalkalivibrio paradoxus ARh 1 TaxID=713585 RepID=W0DTL4_9GAMM|nr:hypothetical protein [Thioalkalivibrio paradoxus]AHF00334.1 hypothetical protein THITH_17360 [Thioalkalivibrio paradoxus ARh 1]